MYSKGTTIVGVRALDVGYFSTKFSLGMTEDGQSIKTAIFPSLAPKFRAGLSGEEDTESALNGTVVAIGDNKYFVGVDAKHAASGVDPREVLNNYCLSDKYLALCLGAMHQMCMHDAPDGDLTIQNLVVGLPFNTYTDHKSQLAAKLARQHTVGRTTRQSQETRTVNIERVTVVVQPQGTVTCLRASQPGLLNDNSVLVADAGGGTFDWYFVAGIKSNWQRSGAHARSMLSCAYAVADSIDKDWRNNFSVIERIDSCVRLKKPSFNANGKSYFIANYKSVIEAVIDESIEKMIAKVGSLVDVDIILFTGGGAEVFSEFFRLKYPEFASRVAIDADPVFANVRGFHLIGDVIASRTANK